ncbi:MAG TPA: Maf family protein [Puia sp.]|jgi:septum formation protein|nr:Maf family protein [Puia sp.]
MERIVLASGSPRRRQLLEWAEIDFDVLVKETPESYPPGMAAAQVPVHIARNKALAVKAMVDPGRILLAADTVVVLKDEIIGKPRDREDAIGILSRLAGNKHEVITGVVLVKGEQEIAFADVTAVWFHELDQQQLAAYVDKYKPYDKAGAYAIQEWIGVVGIKGIQGDFYNVMGLPVSRVVRELARLQAAVR